MAESRAAIPVALGFGFSPMQSLLLGGAGTIILLPFLLWFFRYGVIFISERSEWCKKFFESLFAKKKLKHEKHFAVVSFITLFIFTAIPIPGTGAYTASVIAAVFRVPFWKAVGAIWLGLIVSALLVLGLSLGVVSIF